MATEMPGEDLTGGLRLPVEVMDKARELSEVFEAMASEIDQCMVDLLDERGGLTDQGRVAERMAWSLYSAVEALEQVRREPGGDLFDVQEYIRASGRGHPAAEDLGVGAGAAGLTPDSELALEASVAPECSGPTWGEFPWAATELGEFWKRRLEGFEWPSDRE